MDSYTGDSMRKLLKRAQDTYGYKNQISVCVEEACELGQILSKYARYSNHEAFCEALYKDKTLRDHVIDEMADMSICLTHLDMMFTTLDEVSARVDSKLERLKRWMDNSSSMEHTMIDREVKMDEPEGV